MSDERAVMRALRDHREGVLLCDGVVNALRFVSDHGSGRLVFPSTDLVFGAEERVLFVPEESAEALQLLLVEPAAADPDTDEACDRWRAYHGTPEHPRWVSCAIESGRLGGAVVEGDVLMAANPLRPVEARVCRRLNADKALLTRLCARFAGVDVPEPQCVGVDPGGLHVRARFGVVRVRFGSEADAPERAEAEIGALIREAGR